MALTTNNSDRMLLSTMLEEYEKYSTIGEARFIVTAESISEAIDASSMPIPPILPLKPYEKLGAISEIGKLQAKDTFGNRGDKSKPFVIKNEIYEVSVSTRDYQKEYPRTKMHASKKTGRHTQRFTPVASRARTHLFLSRMIMASGGHSVSTLKHSVS